VCGDLITAHCLLNKIIGDLMKQGLQTVKSWLDALTGLLVGLLVVTLLIGIIWSDQFGTLGNLEAFLSRVGDKGLAGLLAIVLVCVWYKKK
jgi:hypothetical protein